MARHGLSNDEWSLVRPVLCRRRSPRGRPPAEARRILEGILWVLGTGAPWRDLPRRFGPWQTVYGRFQRWVRCGLFDRLCVRLRRRVRVEQGLWCVDTTVIRASRAAGGARDSTRERGEPADHALGRSRGGFGSKLSLVCDSKGTPLAAVVGPGQRHDLKLVEASIGQALSEAKRAPDALAGDRAYSAPWLRAWLEQRSIRPVIPTRSDQRHERSFRRRAYKGRNVVERLVGWLKESRRVATRYEKLAVTYLGFVKLAMIKRLLRVAEFSNKP